MNQPRAAAAADSRYAFGVVCVFAAGLCWSIGGLVVRLMESAQEWQILFYRSLTLAVFLFLLITLRSGGHALRVFARAGKRSLAAGAVLSVAFMFWIFALTHTTVANALFLLCTAIFITALLGWIFLGESVRRATWIAMTAATIGAGVMVYEGVVSGNLFGNLMALGASVGFSIFAVILRSGKNRDMTPAAFWAGFCSLVATGAYIALFTDLGFAVSGRDFFLCATMGMVQVGLGLFLLALGASHVPATEMALLSLVEVVLGTVWVWIFIGEVPSALTIIGGGVMFASIAGYAIRSVRRPPPMGVV